MTNFETVILPNISQGRPSFAVSSLNKESNLLIITLCGKYFLKKCTNAVIIERQGNSDTNIISMVADMKFQVVVLDDCFYDAIDADALFRKLQLLQIEKEFKVIVYLQYACLKIFHNMELPKASIVWLPDNYRHLSLNSYDLRYYNAAIDT